MNKTLLWLAASTLYSALIDFAHASENKKLEKNNLSITPKFQKIPEEIFKYSILSFGDQKDLSTTALTNNKYYFMVQEERIRRAKEKPLKAKLRKTKSNYVISFLKLSIALKKPVALHLMIDNGTQLKDILPYCSFVHSLQIESEGEFIKELLQYLPKENNLTSLNLRNNNISATGVKALAESVALKNLISLDLSFNNIGDEGTEVIAKSETFKNLTLLNLGINNIGDEGAKIIAKTETLKNLLSLNFWSNLIGVEGAVALATSKKLKNLSSLNLFGNGIGVEGKKALEKRFGKITW